jgi:hypothetical protein
VEYHTKYELETSPLLTEEIEDAIGNDDYMLLALQIKCNWDNHEEHMRNLSLKFPDYIFKLSGVGEEPGDLWIKYFKNGKMQFCPAHILFEDYDKNKME